MPGKKKRKRERAVQQQDNFCFFCWKSMEESLLDLPDSACLVSLDPPGAPWEPYMHWPRFVAAHVRCASEINDMRQASEGYVLKLEAAE